MDRRLVLAMMASLALSVGPASAQISRQAFEAAQKKLDHLQQLDAPKGAHGLHYAPARKRLVDLGFDPLPIVGRATGTCSGDAPSDYCAKWPETEACSNAGDCRFLWRRRKDGKLLIVQTQDSRGAPVVMSTWWGQMSDKCQYTYPHGLTVQALANALPPADAAKPCGPPQKVR